MILCHSKHLDMVFDQTNSISRVMIEKEREREIGERERDRRERERERERERRENILKFILYVCL